MVTAEHPEDPTCPDCGRPARCVLLLHSIGTGPTIEHGEACIQATTGSGNTNWKAFVH